MAVLRSWAPVWAGVNRSGPCWVTGTVRRTPTSCHEQWCLRHSTPGNGGLWVFCRSSFPWCGLANQALEAKSKHLLQINTALLNYTVCLTMTIAECRAQGAVLHIHWRNRTNPSDCQDKGYQHNFSLVLCRLCGTVWIPYFSCINSSVKLKPTLSLTALWKRLLADSLFQQDDKGNIQRGPGEHIPDSALHKLLWDNTGMLANRIFGSSSSSGGREQPKSS